MGDKLVQIHWAAGLRDIGATCAFKGQQLIGQIAGLARGLQELNGALRVKHMGENWEAAKVRGTPHNTGDGLLMALELGAADYGLYSGCHATPMDLHMADFGNLDLPPGERKNYRKISYF